MPRERTVKGPTGFTFAASVRPLPVRPSPLSSERHGDVRDTLCATVLTARTSTTGRGGAGGDGDVAVLTFPDGSLVQNLPGLDTYDPSLPIGMLVDPAPEGSNAG